VLNEWSAKVLDDIVRFRAAAAKPGGLEYADTMDASTCFVIMFAVMTISITYLGWCVSS
jgi:hypothetical protein